MRKPGGPRSASTRFPLSRQALISCVVAAASPVVFAAEDACTSAVPDGVKAAIESEYAGWKLVRLSDLEGEGLTQWVSAHGRACPGIAEGSFSGVTRREYAVLLWKGKPHQQLQLLLAAQEPKGGYQVSRVHGQRADRLSVVSTAPPGRYRAEGGKTPVVAAHDVIMLDTAEARTMAFYAVQGTFRSLVIFE